MKKQPISSTGTDVMTPPVVCVSITPFPGGEIWPSRECPETSSSMDRLAEVKVSDLIEAVSDRMLAFRASSCAES